MCGLFSKLKLKIHGSQFSFRIQITLAKICFSHIHVQLNTLHYEVPSSLDTTDKQITNSTQGKATFPNQVLCILMYCGQDSGSLHTGVTYFLYFMQKEETSAECCCQSSSNIILLSGNLGKVL